MWDKKFVQTDRKKFLHLIDYIIDAIDSGKLKSGEPLPTQRELSKKLNLSIGTITKAFKELEKLGYLSGVIGRGTFVKDITSEYVDFWLTESKVPYKHNLGHFRTTELFNHTIQLNLLSGIKEVANSPELFFKLNDLNNNGSPAQKEVFMNWLANRGFSNLNQQSVSIFSEQIATLNLIIHTLTNPGDKVLLEQIGDRITYDQVVKAHCTPDFVALDNDGIVPESLEEVITKSGAKLLITNPTLHNPTSITTSLKRKKQIAQVCANHDVIIIEDGKLDFFLDERIPSYFEINPKISLYLSGFYFYINPALGTSLVLGDQNLLKQLENQFKTTQWTPMHLLIETTVNLLSTGRADKIISERRELLKERNHIFDEIFDTQSNPAEVLKWLELPSHWTSARFTQAAYEQGILVRNSDIFSLQSGLNLPFIRLCNSTIHSTDQYREALLEIKELLEEQPVGY